MQEEVRPDQRVMSGALLLLVMNFIGLGLGPTYVGAASDYFRASHPDHSLQIALYTLMPFYVLAIVLFLWLARVLRREKRKAGEPSHDLLRRLIACAAVVAPRAVLAASRGDAMSHRPKPVPIVNAPAGPGAKAHSEGALRRLQRHSLSRCRRWARCAGGRRARCRAGRACETRREFGPACIQPPAKLDEHLRADSAPMSEDCLTLNIWAPADAHNAPVFVWIHGGALCGRREPRDRSTTARGSPRAASSSSRSTIALGVLG